MVTSATGNERLIGSVLELGGACCSIVADLSIAGSESCWARSGIRYSAENETYLRNIYCVQTGLVARCKTVPSYCWL